MPRRSSTAGRLMTSRPSIVIRPLVGSMSRFTIFIVVVLPQPDGPTRTQISPAGTVRVRSLTASGVPGPPYRLVTCSKATTAPAGSASCIGRF